MEFGYVGGSRKRISYLDRELVFLFGFFIFREYIIDEEMLGKF